MGFEAALYRRRKQFMKSSTDGQENSNLKAIKFKINEGVYWAKVRIYRLTVASFYKNQPIRTYIYN